MIKLDYIDFLPSPHKSTRKNLQKPSWVIIHAMAGTMEGTKAWFRNPKSKVSAHYLVSKKGDVLCMVKPELAAWHVKNFNSPTLGIEFEDLDPKTKKNCLSDPKWITDKQLEVGAELVAALMLRYKISMSNIIGHNDKYLQQMGNDHSDPGPYFPWDKFRKLIASNLEPKK